MIGLPTTVSARTSVGSASTCAQRSAISSSTHVADRLGQLRSRRPGSSSRTTRGSSGPRRTGSAGSSRRRPRARSPLARSHSWPATVVDPTSNATPSARSRNPGQTPTIVAPSCTATVAVQSPARSVRCSAASTWSSHVETGERPVALQRLEQPLQVAGRVGHVGLADLDVVQAHDRVDLDRVGVGLLPHDLPVQLALRRHVHDQVADHLRVAPEPPLRRQPRPVAIRLLRDRERREMVCARGDAVLRELALAHDDLAPAADPSAAAHRVEVHAERTSGRRAGWSRARTARACPTA